MTFRPEGRDERDRMDELPEGCKWYVVKTNPRCEPRAAASIRGASFTVYVPMLLRQYRHHRHKRWIEREFPLFVGYLFVALPEPGKSGVIKNCDGVRGVLAGMKEAMPIPTKFVANLQASQRDGHFDRMRPVTPHGYTVNDRVLIAKGQFTDFIATVVDASRPDELKVLTKIFNSEQEVTVAVDFVRHAA